MPFPILAAAQAGAGIIQSIFGGIQAKKAQKQLDRLQTPTYTANKSILDYYNKALDRYNVDPYQSSLYKQQAQNINRNTASALNSLGDRRSGLAGISSIYQGQNDALLNAGVAAEAEQGNRLNQLGNAASMKAMENDKEFQFNKIAPYEKKYGILAAKAAGGNQVLNSGLSNIFGGLQNGYQMNMYKNLYGSNETASDV